MDQPLTFLFLESFYGGSHRDFADGIVSHSTHQVELVTLPARFWKWRMRGAALHFVRKIEAIDHYDGIIVTDLMSLADFKALTGPHCPPVLVYFHENQLSYPLAPGERMDYQFGFTDITTALTADRLLFNSHHHLSSFLAKLPSFIGMMPEYHPGWVPAAISAKAKVLHPGCLYPGTDDLYQMRPKSTSPPLIIWNHRWEFDKNPDAFFKALDSVDRRGIRFRLALLGENFQAVPKAFIEAKNRFRNQIVAYGYEPSKTAYHRWLQQGAIVVSTAHQENFGISIVEAIRWGCVPLLPNRLSYPEILPRRYHTDYLYENQTDLIDKLSRLLTDPQRQKTIQPELSIAMGRYAWERVIADYDHELEKLAATHK